VHLETIQETLLEDTREAVTFRRDSMQQLSRIDSLEQVSKTSLQYGHASMVSLASIASSIALIERRLSVARVSFTTNGYCDDSGILQSSRSAGSLKAPRTKGRSTGMFTLGPFSDSDCSVTSECSSPIELRTTQKRDTSTMKVEFLEDIKTAQQLVHGAEVDKSEMDLDDSYSIIHGWWESFESINNESPAMRHKKERQKILQPAPEPEHQTSAAKHESSLLTVDVGIVKNIDMRNIDNILRMWTGKTKL
jgi:hypothetical protein